MKFNDPALIVFIGVTVSIIGAFLGGVGALLYTRQQTKGQMELRQKSEEIATLYNKIAESQLDLREKAENQAEVQRQLRQKSEEIAELNKDIAAAQRDLRKKSEEIAELNKDIAATVTGGDSYCHIDIYRPGKLSNIVDLMLMHEGKYPSYDVTIKIDDVEKMLNMFKSEERKGNIPYSSMTEAFTMMAQSSKIIRVGNIGPNQGMQLDGLILPDTDRQSYNISITARNGIVSQIVRFRRVKGEWKIAHQINIPSKGVLERIDPDFPRDEDGKVKW
ncbi:MAG: hypothetical protein WC405_04965 [Syntrophales bacterium]